MPSKFKISLSFVLTLVIFWLVGLNIIYGCITVLSKTQNRKPVFEPGYQFEDIRKILKQEKIVGYLTDRNISPEKNDQEFLLAQYMLAPTIVEVNNHSYQFLILDYTNPSAVINKLKEIKAKPIYKNMYNKVLALQRP